MRSLPCTMIRGGTSRGAYCSRDAVPAEPAERDALMVRAMGGPDALQIDGIGGGHPLTSKVAIVGSSSDDRVDVDYLFLQVDPVSQKVSDRQNCGNLLAGVGLYAIDEGLVEAVDPSTTVRVRMLNTGALCNLEVPTPSRRIASEGTTVIDGVPGAAPPIVCNYLDIAGSSCGALLPTGHPCDEVDGVAVTCVDNGMPVVVMRAQDFGLTGSELPELLDADDRLRSRLEAIRLEVGDAMNLGDVSDLTVPKMCLVSPARKSGVVMTRTFIPHVCHKSIGVLGAVSVATACLMPESVVAEFADLPAGNPKVMAVEHPSGSLSVNMQLDDDGAINQAGVVRTARIIFKGNVYV